jgi:monoamine oxidase
VFTGAGVIVALPPPLVGRIAFVPELPSHRLELLREATMGCIIKSTILYRTAFWRSAGFSGEVICDTTTSISGPAFNVYDACLPVLSSSLDPSNPQGIVFADATVSDPSVRLGAEYT